MLRQPRTLNRARRPQGPLLGARLGTGMQKRAGISGALLGSWTSGRDLLAGGEADGQLVLADRLGTTGCKARIVLLITRAAQRICGLRGCPMRQGGRCSHRDCKAQHEGQGQLNNEDRFLHFNLPNKLLPRPVVRTKAPCSAISEWLMKSAIRIPQSAIVKISAPLPLATACRAAADRREYRCGRVRC